MAYGFHPTSAFMNDDRLTQGYSRRRRRDESDVDRPLTRPTSSPPQTLYSPDSFDDIGSFEPSIHNMGEFHPDLIHVQYGSKSFTLELAQDSIAAGDVTVGHLRDVIAYDQDLSQRPYCGVISFRDKTLDDDLLPILSYGCEKGCSIVISDVTQGYEQVENCPSPDSISPQVLPGTSQNSNNINIEDDHSEHRSMIGAETDDEDEDLRRALELSMKCSDLDESENAAVEDSNGGVDVQFTRDDAVLMGSENYAQGLNESSVSDVKMEGLQELQNAQETPLLQNSHHQELDHDINQESSCSPETGSTAEGPSSKADDTSYSNVKAWLTDQSRPDIASSIDTSSDPDQLYEHLIQKISPQHPTQRPSGENLNTVSWKQTTMSRSPSVDQQQKNPPPLSTRTVPHIEGTLASQEASKSTSLNEWVFLLVMSSKAFREVRLQILEWADDQRVRIAFHNAFKRFAIRLFRRESSPARRMVGMRLMSAASDKRAIYSATYKDGADIDRKYHELTIKVSDDPSPLMKGSAILGSRVIVSRELHVFSEVIFEQHLFESFLSEFALLSFPTPIYEASMAYLSSDSLAVRSQTRVTSTYGNELKGAIEDRTHTRWNWWPLSPRRLQISDGCVRISWQCLCNETLSADIPKAQAVMIEKICRWQYRPVKRYNLCKMRAKPARFQFKIKRLLFVLCVELITFVVELIALITQAGVVVLSQGFSLAVSSIGQATMPVASSSQSGQSNTNNTLQPTSSHNSQGSTTSKSLPLSGSASTNLSSGTPPTSLTMQNSILMPIDGEVVLVGIKGLRRSLELLQVKVQDSSSVLFDDAQFFAHIRSSFSSIKGILRFYFSIWRLNHCRFMKFENYECNRVSDVCEDLPTSPEYGYEPRPPVVSIANPGISKHIFERALLPSCGITLFGKDIGCPWTIFNFLGHECVGHIPPGNRYYLRRIPQKDTPWLIDTVRDINYAWGIKVETEVSALYVLIYHLLILTGPFAVWGYLMSRRDQGDSSTDSGSSGSGGLFDLQNPSVPTTIAIALLSLFWASAQPLGVFRPAAKI